MAADSDTRFARQIRFGGWGEAGQSKLAASRIVIVGCGALGSLQAELLARAGAGTLVLIDRDYVEIGNLHRQFLYDEDAARDSVPKAAAAAARIRSINSRCETVVAVADLTQRNADDLLGGADLILDGTDNFETRYLVNDFCVSYGIPWIYGGAVASYGITMPVVPGRTACLTCVYPKPPGGVQPTCETAGVLNTVTSTVASLQVASAMRVIAGVLEKSVITTVDVWTGVIRQIDAPAADRECRTCGQRDFQHLKLESRVPVSLCGRNAVQIHEHERPLDIAALGDQLRTIAPVRANEFALRFFPDPYEITIFPDGRAIIKGTTDVGLARSLYARYVGS